MFTYEAPINAVGDLVVAAASLSVCLSLLDMTWPLAALLFLALAVASAAVLELGLNLHIAALVLRFRGSESLFFWLDNTAGNFGNYPLAVFPTVLQGAFTFGIPIAFAGYYPAAWLTGHTDTVPFTPVLVYLSPLVATLALAAGLATWRRCLGWYARNG